jgi:hypothetical protein
MLKDRFGSSLALQSAGPGHQQEVYDFPDQRGPPEQGRGGMRLVTAAATYRTSAAASKPRDGCAAQGRRSAPGTGREREEIALGHNHPTWRPLPVGWTSEPASLLDLE